METGTVTGTVKWFDSKKGFGFIKGSQEGQDIFVHYTNIEGEGFRSLKNGETVEYELVESDKGLQAHHVRSRRPAPPPKSPPGVEPLEPLPALKSPAMDSPPPASPA